MNIIELTIGILGGGTVLFGVIWGGWKIYHHKKAPKIMERKALLKIIPSQKNEKTPGVAEHMFSILHGVFEPIGFWDRLKGKTQSTIAFEIVKMQGKIHFFVRSEPQYIQFIRSQVYAHYPEAEVEIAKEYCFIKNARVEWQTLSTKNSSLWPFRRYSQFESGNESHDPLSGVFQALGDAIEPNELAGIQLIVRPVDDMLFRENAKEALQKSLARNLGGWKTLYENFLLEPLWWKRIMNTPKKFFMEVLSSRSKLNEEGKEVDTEGELKQSHEKESLVSSANDKMSRLIFLASVRVFHAVSAKKKKPLNTRSILSSFKSFSLPYLNELVGKGVSTQSEKIEEQWRYLCMPQKFPVAMMLSTEELATLFHLPNENMKDPNIHWVSSRKISSPTTTPSIPEKGLTLLGRTNYRGYKKVFGMRTDDRRRHVYIAGKTGMGKSTLLENMIYSDIQNGNGVAIVDPHGDLAESILTFIPKNRTNDVILFDPSDRDFPISFNILECPNQEHRHLVASSVVGVFQKMFAESWGPRLEHILRNTLLALIECGGQSLLGVMRMLSDEQYRRGVLKKVHDPIVLSFWNDEFGRWNPKQVSEAVSPIQNKVGQFLSSGLVRNILGQTKSSFSLRFAMDTKKIMVINLSKGKIGEDISTLLGAMMITKFQLDVMSRSDIKEKDRTDFYLYVDEFQNFATQSFATILSEARKYKLNLTVANQYLAQMEDVVREAVFGNVGTLVTFQVGFDDAKTLSEQFGGEDIIEPSDIGSLPKYHIYLRLMIDGMPSSVFSSQTLPPPDHIPSEEQIEKIINFSRQRYAKPREKVEDRIKKWSTMGK